MEIALSNRIALGRWWFRNRSLSPVPLLVLMVWLAPDFELDVPLLLMGVLSVTLSEGLRLWAVSYAGSATRTRGDQVHQLVIGGPYRWTRNPLYVANIGLYASFTFLFGHFILTVAAVLYFILQYTLIISYEESLLEDRFGQSYRDYCAAVPRWFWGDRTVMGPSDLLPDLKSAFRSERSTLFAIGAMWLIWMWRR
ncbi:MAG: isoprenylcysteine carboxylmethyltransferase family protein [Deltaproteobacteria bacterium]|nr:isoprenylcysteine carboxylmethyltransferase family protein [Deltaproteobacteria bacterium]MBI3294748.1 isoprenylcysteine carboxylmethyltransferase family protein [Deltaproteobacteria bacterium]